ncbi:PP2C family protein-serine/threonine phosphatase [Streptomyces olivaceus]|uniref:PP2C family protein-serine/threonine phosphatase n=1 Tax=Streptomyces olivaceus TaxID=47716 RepID=UPI003644D955
MRNYATARNIGGRSHQCDVTVVVTAPGNVRAYVLLDGVGSTPEVAHWTRGAALRLGSLAARRGNAEAGLRAAYALYANDPARHDPWADLPHAAAVVAVTTPGGPLTVAWSGDARAYLWNGAGFRRLTRDHNERRTRPLYGRKNILTSCLGAADTDDALQDAHGHLAVESVTRDLTGRDRLFLMSDGAYEPIEESTLDLEDFAPGALEDVPSGIVETAVEMWGEDADNATALVADLWY